MSGPGILDAARCALLFIELLSNSASKNFICGAQDDAHKTHAQSMQEYLLKVFKLLIFVIILFKIITKFVYYYFVNFIYNLLIYFYYNK